MALAHEAVFYWPHSEPSSVVVTGTFDQWSSSIRLTKGSSGFKGSVQIPWGERIAYKFIVDGRWSLLDGQPTERDNVGNVNNVYVAPPKPPTPATVAEPVSSQDDSMTKATNGIANGSAFEGETAKHTESGGNVAGAGDEPSASLERGVAPPTTSSQKDSTKSAPDVNPVHSEKISAESSNQVIKSPVDKAVEQPTATEASRVAPDVPISIVPVNVPENNTSEAESEVTTSGSTYPPAPYPTVDNAAASVSDEPETSTHAVVTAPTSGSAEPVVGVFATGTDDKVTEPVLDQPTKVTASEPPAVAVNDEAPSSSINDIKEDEDGIHSCKPDEPTVFEIQTPSDVTPTASPNTPVPAIVPEVSAPEPLTSVVDTPATPAPVTSEPAGTIETSKAIATPVAIAQRTNGDETKVEKVKEAEAAITEEDINPPPAVVPPTKGQNGSQPNGTSTNGAANHASAPSPLKSSVESSRSSSTPSAPVTPTKSRHSFPTGSPSPTSSKFGTPSSRKKKPSIFGKLKHMFDHHDKEKQTKEKVKK